MRLPIVCLDQRLRHFLATFQCCFSQPQYQYFVTILLGLILCQSSQTLSGLLRQASQTVTLSGTSRFMAKAPWSADELGQTWQRQFRQELASLVAAEHARLRQRRQKKRGRPKKTVVTGYLIGDDSTMMMRRGKEMGGLGRHYSGTEKKTVTGHSLVQGLYLLLGRRCPLTPRIYRQQEVCQAEGKTFVSKMGLTEEIIHTFEPLVGTTTHVLLDCWYGCKRIGKAAWERGFTINTGLRANRSLRIEDTGAPKGWRWQRLDEYAAALLPDQWQRVKWPTEKGMRGAMFISFPLVSKSSIAANW
jgi:hypothetical protein